MVIMLNGSFGIGKTTTAQALVQCLPHAMIFDPEEVGMMLRAMTHGIRSPHEDTGDFQDLALWPAMTVLTAERVYQHYQRTLIVSMTIIKPSYFQEIKAGLAHVSPPIHHFCLTASLPIIQHRLLARGEALGGWSWQTAEKCVWALRGPAFEEYIDAEHQPTAAIVQQILQRVAL